MTRIGHYRMSLILALLTIVLLCAVYQMERSRVARLQRWQNSLTECCRIDIKPLRDA